MRWRGWSGALVAMLGLLALGQVAGREPDQLRSVDPVTAYVMRTQTDLL